MPCLASALRMTRPPSPCGRRKMVHRWTRSVRQDWRVRADFLLLEETVLDWMSQ